MADLCPHCPPPETTAAASVLPAAYGQVLLMSLVILGHCSGMCGPLLLSFRFGMEQDRRAGRLWRAAGQLTAYQSGRAVVYAAAGGIAGGLGGILGNSFVQDLTGNWAVIPILLALGFLAVAMMRSFGWRFGESGAQPGLLGRLGQAWRRHAGDRPYRYAGGLGFLLGFLPCGLTAMVLGLAVATGSVLHGALVMLLLVLLTTVPLAPFALLPSALPRFRGRGALAVQLTGLWLTAIWMSLQALAKNGVIPHAHWHIGDFNIMFF